MSTETIAAPEQSVAEQPAASTLLAQVAQAAAAVASTASEQQNPPAGGGVSTVAGIQAGVSAVTALEFLAVGYPSMKAAIDPLIAAVNAGATDDVFAKAVIAGLQASTLVTATAIRSQPKDNAIQQPAAKGEPSETTLAALNPASIYAARNAAMKPARP